MTAALPADPVGQVIEIGLEPLNAPSAPADQTAFAPQARDDALSLQEAEIALKDPENDAEPPIGLFAEEPPAVRALAIGPATEPAATPPADAEGYVAAPDPNLQSDEEPPLLDMPWLRPDPLPDKENRAPTVAQDQTEEPSAPDAAPLAEPVNIPPVTAALAQTDQSVAPSPREDASPEETNPLAAVRPMARPASLPSPVRPKTLPDGKRAWRAHCGRNPVHARLNWPRSCQRQWWPSPQKSKPPHSHQPQDGYPVCDAKKCDKSTQYQSYRDNRHNAPAQRARAPFQWSGRQSSHRRSLGWRTRDGYLKQDPHLCQIWPFDHSGHATRLAVSRIRDPSFRKCCHARKTGHRPFQYTNRQCTARALAQPQPQ